ncbi:glycosyltransferase family 87 protein [Brooklawnia cerclae]|uniref:DUF2029 domain-containing protein n=1 Tax=Brooklawnia cerclae TaxID=349934 RepID=A0ABX0SDE2_9ACTN|nr:glycosyltransferase 87 family protein [Brooklawnia cerclae]NIH56413.1 hypothetical protein [Brooklawnia cerclae]
MDEAPHSSGASRAKPPVWHRRLISISLRVFRDWDLETPRSLLLLWFVARLAVLLVWGVLTPSTQGDVVYYYEHIENMMSVGPAQTMTEYPTPVLWLLTVPWLLGFGTQQGYVIVFVLMMLGLDIWYTLALWRLGGRLGAHAAVFWTLFIAFIGPTVYLRFDLVTSVLAGASLLLLLRRRWSASGALAGAGAAIKLWPALLWPALCGGTWRHKLRASLGFWVTGGALALVSLLWAGWDRLISPLTWQSGRGLQVESIWASVPMLLRATGLFDYAVTISRYQAFEIYGLSVPFWEATSSIATIVGMVAIAIAYLAWWRRGHGRAMEAAALMLLVILVMIATNKTFSPQYMIWLGGPQAAAYAILGRRTTDSPGYAGDRARVWHTSVMILLITLLTGIVYPIGYDPLVRDTTLAGWVRFPITVVLVIRNVLVCVLLGVVVKWVWGFVRPGSRSVGRAGPTPADQDHPTMEDA